MTTEWAVMHPSFPDVAHRGPWSRQECEDWIAEAESDGMRKGAFYLARREVSPWTPVNPNEDL